MSARPSRIDDCYFDGISAAVFRLARYCTVFGDGQSRRKSARGERIVARTAGNAQCRGIRRADLADDGRLTLYKKFFKILDFYSRVGYIDYAKHISCPDKEYGLFCV